MIKVLAAQRLIANGDEQQARDFIASIADIKVGKLELNAPGMVRFTVDTPEDFVKARTALTHRYGKMDTSGSTYGSHGGQWKIAEGHHLLLSDTRTHGAHKGSRFSMSLIDDKHKESPRDLIRRIIGPPKNISMK